MKKKTKTVLMAITLLQVAVAGTLFWLAFSDYRASGLMEAVARSTLSYRMCSPQGAEDIAAKKAAKPGENVATQIDFIIQMQGCWHVMERRSRDESLLGLALIMLSIGQFVWLITKAKGDQAGADADFAQANKLKGH